MDYYELLYNVIQLECELFIKMDSYHLIERKCCEKCFNADDRQQLNFDIHYIFAILIKIVKEECPDLTKDDIIFCCLNKLGLNNMIICHCMGTVSKQSVNQRKYRIKKKMKDAECDFLFDMIFKSCYK